uniref:Uncharacterized protein n=1 Tax=Arundo donax TaxID=35708 RepID=A0A0A9GJT3_ARUDO
MLLNSIQPCCFTSRFLSYNLTGFTVGALDLDHSIRGSFVTEVYPSTYNYCCLSSRF